MLLEIDWCGGLVETIYDARVEYSEVINAEITSRQQVGDELGTILRCHEVNFSVVVCTQSRKLAGVATPAVRMSRNQNDGCDRRPHAGSWA